MKYCVYILSIFNKNNFKDRKYLRMYNNVSNKESLCQNPYLHKYSSWEGSTYEELFFQA